MTKKLLLLFLLFGLRSLWGQTEKTKQLEKQICSYNDNLQYEKSIKVLTSFLADEQASNYDRYYAYLLKSYTYKRLFNYSQTMYNLDLALTEGLKSDRKEEVTNTIEAEKCFVYFDTEDYKKAAIYIDHLRKLKFKHLSIATKSWIIMQEGYIKMLDKDYAKAEQLLDEALELVAKNSPENLPNIYGKKIELYNKMKLYSKRDAVFKEGLVLAKKYKKIKYELYLYEVMRNLSQENKDFKNAFIIQKKYDSISKYYDAINSSSNLELNEKKYLDENIRLKAQNETYIKYILIGIIGSLLVLLFLAFRLYKANKSKRILIEEENSRIHYQIELLTKTIDDKGNAALDLSNYTLTEQQKNIIDFIKNGLTNKEIASKLFISANTVKYHLKIIYEILDIENRSLLRHIK